jgi:hypothetical protein
MESGEEIIDFSNVEKSSLELSKVFKVGMKIEVDIGRKLPVVRDGIIRYIGPTKIISIYHGTKFKFKN